MKKNSAVVFCGTSNFAFAMASVIMDLKRVSPAIADEIVIIHDGKMSATDKQLISSLWTTRFIEYNFPLKDTSNINQNTFNYFTQMVFAKYECLKLLNDYKTVLFSDYDVVIQQDISELMTPSATGIKMLPSGACVGNQLWEQYRTLAIEDYDLKAEGICGSLFVFQDHLNDYMRLYDFCYESLARYGHCLYLGEQAIFDFMIQRFNLQIEPLPHDLYTTHPDDKKKRAQARILHAYGQPKFWNGIRHAQWHRNYAAWVKMGGTKYSYPLNIRSVVNQISIRLRYQLNKLITHELRRKKT